MVATVAIADDDRDRFTYRVEGKPMSSNAFGGWETLVGYSSVSKPVAVAKKEAATAHAIRNRTGRIYRVQQNRIDRSYRPLPGSDYWGDGR